MNNCDKLINFLNNSYTCYHAINNIEEMLVNNGFTRLYEDEIWSLEPNKNYYVIKNSSSIIAFKVPGSLVNTGFQIVASHSDSPSYKVKPNGVIVDKRNDYTKLNTEPYGGMIDTTWLDRPLGIAGRVVLNDNNNLVEKIVTLDETIIIPNVAIHLNRPQTPTLNPQVDMLPIIGNSDTSFSDMLNKHIDSKEIVSSDLYLYNKEEAIYVGANKEYIASGRIDDLECAYASIEALVNAEAKNIIVSGVFNHEEVGSRSNNGAASTFLKDTLEKIMNSFSLDKYTTLAKSVIISADNAHAVHPNHPEKSDSTNCVYMNKGIVIKHQAGLSYTTDAISDGIFKMVCKKAEVPFQDYTNRSDMRGGGTLGSISLGQVSIHSVDIGLAQLAMHSTYETTGTIDLDYMVKALKVYYNTYIKISKNGVKFE